jgi:hypothetical protein
MLSHLVIALVLIASVHMLRAQDPGTHVEILRSDLSKYLTNCSVKDEADVQKEIKRQADRAEMVENVLSFALLVITGDEAGKAELEGIPAFLNKAKTGASLVGYWDKFTSWWAGKSKVQTFDVCEPMWGVIVVKPLKGTLPLAAGLAGAPPQRPLLLSYNDLMKPSDNLMKQAELATLCLSPSMLHSFTKAPYAAGRVVEMTLLGRASTTPVASQWVRLVGPGYQRGCSTTQDGEFSFSQLPAGSYALYVGSVQARNFTIDTQSDLSLGDLPLPLVH